MQDQYVEMVQALIAEHPGIFLIAILAAIVVVVARVFTGAAR